MLSLFQEQSPHEDMVKKESLQCFVQELESRFFVEEKVGFIDVLRVCMKGLVLPRTIRRPCRVIEQAVEFWKQLDSDLSNVNRAVQVVSSK